MFGYHSKSLISFRVTMCQCTRICASVLVYVPVYSYMCQCTRICASVLVYVPVYSYMCQCTRICASVLVLILILSDAEGYYDIWVILTLILDMN